MVNHFPYISSDYLSEAFKPTELAIHQITMAQSERAHYRNEIEFILIIKGQASIEINQLQFDLQPGNLIQLMPYHVHRFIIEQGQSLAIIQIRFSIGLLLLTSTNRQTYLKSIKKLDTNVPIIKLPHHAFSQLRVLCQEVIYEKQEAAATNFEALHISLISFISYLYMKYQKQSQVMQLNPAWRVLQYVQVHHQENLTPINVAQRLGLAAAEVKSLIRQLTGQSFNQILNQVRIRNATALLQFEELSANQIGTICGYQTQANFYKQFKLIHDMSPEIYRETNLAVNQASGSIDAWSIIMVILENCTQAFSLNQLTTMTHLSSSKIESLLKNSVQMTFKQLLNRFRVQIGNNLLMALDLSVAEVADKTGFTDSSAFIRNYRKVYGDTPGKQVV